jgi:hypothetical protein
VQVPGEDVADAVGVGLEFDSDRDERDGPERLREKAFFGAGKEVGS